MTLREFFGVIRSRWRLIAACLLVVVAAAAVATLRATPVYVSSAKVYLSSSAPDKTKGATTGAYVISQQDLNTFAEITTSPSVLDPLRAKLGLPEGTPISLSADVSQSSNMLTLTATSSDPDQAAEIANAAGQVLADVALKFAPLLATNGQKVEATTITPAAVPSRPVSPDPQRNVALGILAGLGLGLGLALLRHTLDTRVRDKTDIANLSDRPLLGEIPLIKDPRVGVLSIESDPHGRHAEAIRRLRTNLLFVDVTTGGHSFVVTSSVPGEGKTTTTINLAMAMADSGLKVLLIDGDLRNPSVAASMGLEGSVGLTTVLLGRADPDEVIQQRGDSSLFVLPAGQVPPNPSELLGSEPMEALFGKLTHEFEFILVDSPPVVPVIDAVLINKLTHGLIMVVAADRTRKRDLASAITSLETVGAPVSGFALNFESSTMSAGYRYGYYGHNTAAADSRVSHKPEARRSRRR